MRVLHVSKTSEGAHWAVRQAAQLVRLGVEVHVALPDAVGGAIANWRSTGAVLHFMDCALPVTKSVRYFKTGSAIRELVCRIRPDLIHSHHVTTTAMLRLALGKHHPIPRIFQVAGPLHLEHWHSRAFELSLAGERDYWIGSSKFINLQYERAGIPEDRLFLSYHSADTGQFSTCRTGYLRRKLSIPSDAIVIGNINLIYPPKRFLGQEVGLKGHEDIIQAIALVQHVRDDVWGVLIGGTFDGSMRYEQKLRQFAQEKGGGRILMPGKFKPEEVAWSWPDFDCAIHVPLSENCGGVTEPLLCRVPTIAGNVGGLPEVVHPGVTGELVPVGNQAAMAVALLRILRAPIEAKTKAERGRQLVSAMFDPARCAHEVFSIYHHILFEAPRPAAFDPTSFLENRSQSAHREENPRETELVTYADVPPYEDLLRAQS